MQKQMSSKKIIIMIASAVFVVAAAAVILLSGKDEFFRSILVYDLEGNAVIERADIGTIDAAENLYLESGDRVSVKEESMMRMKLDDDKYITAEENTVFSLEAKGDAKDSKTKINLEQGSITNEIQNPLSGESVYETATPNSVMAVRGTIYRAELSDDGEGGQDMKICCFQGTVATTPIRPDGTMGEEVLVHAGSELTVDSEGNTEGPQDIDFNTLTEQALLTLNDIVSSGTEITGISKEELNSLLSSDNNDVSADTQENETSETEIVKNTTEVSDTAQVDTDDNKQSENDARSDNKKKNNSNNESDSKKIPVNDKDKTTDKEGGTVDKEDKQPQNTTPSSGDTTDKSGNTDSDNGSQDSNSDNGSDDSQDKKPDKDSGSKPKKPSKKVTYTVTYKYQGSVFATQSVKKGDKTTAPTLAPAAEGAWDFNFDTKITADTTIEWK
ncbi:MAG: hypothetical protein K2K46_08660 [Lachnospiraceae bacterium]|nr:hypothetical protein [Lachnospiraceae bacterium]